MRRDTGHTLNTLFMTMLPTRRISRSRYYNTFWWPSALIYNQNPLEHNRLLLLFIISSSEAISWKLFCPADVLLSQWEFQSSSCFSHKEVFLPFFVYYCHFGGTKYFQAQINFFPHDDWVRSNLCCLFSDAPTIQHDHNILACNSRISRQFILYLGRPKTCLVLKWFCKVCLFMLNIGYCRRIPFLTCRAVKWLLYLLICLWHKTQSWWSEYFCPSFETSNKIEKGGLD